MVKNTKNYCEFQETVLFHPEGGLCMVFSCVVSQVKELWEGSPFSEHSRVIVCR